MSSGNGSKSVDPLDRLVDLDVERALLGCVLIEPTMFRQCDDLMGGSRGFTLPQHRRVWDAVRSAHESGQAVDIVSIKYSFADWNAFVADGGNHLLVDLVEAVPCWSNAPVYAEILDRCRARRELYAGCEATMGKLRESGIDNTAEIVGQHAEAVASIRVAGRRKNADVTRLHAEYMAALMSPTADKLPTGFQTLDEAWSGGLGRGELVVVAGRPGHGKSTLAAEVARCVAMAGERGCPVVYYSLEMPELAIYSNIVASLSRVSARVIEQADMPREHLEAVMSESAGRLPPRRLYIVDDLHDEQAILRDAEDRIEEDGVGLVVVDYMQQMRVRQRRRDGTRQEEVAECSRDLKLLALERKVAVLAVAQLNRGVENRTNKIPELSDLRESGAIEQDADVVTMLMRPELYESGVEAGNVLVYVRKQRNGPIGDYRMAFSGREHRIEDLPDNVRRVESRRPPKPDDAPF